MAIPVKERSALFEGTRRTGAADASPSGKQLKAGDLKRGGTGLLSAVFTKRHVVLFSDPMLCFFDDATCSKARVRVLTLGRAMRDTRTNGAASPCRVHLCLAVDPMPLSTSM